MTTSADTHGRTLRGADSTLHPTDSPYLDRELSQVEFNARVLELAADDTRPALERLKFVAICAGNQDEFFQKRIGGLRAQDSAGVRSASGDGLSPGEQLRALRVVSSALAYEQSRLCEEELFPALAAAGLRRCTWEELSDEAQKDVTRRFDNQIFPILTPLAIDQGRPFPHISSLSLNMMVVLARGDADERRLARLKVPDNLARFVIVDDGMFMTVEDVISAHVAALFPGMRIIERHLFRVTRNADIALETGEVDDLLETIEDRLLRRRFGEAVRLEITTDMPIDVRERLMTELELTTQELYEIPGLMNPADLWSLYGLGPQELRDPPWHPASPHRFADKTAAELFNEVRRGDVLVHHPYESFTDSVSAFVDAASRDPQVVAIKLTIYRTSGSESAMVDALIRAAEAGKQAVALVELKARFDEQANIDRARTLEEAGVHVVYGFVGLKTHTKTLLVVREEEDGLRHYAHVGTGNYNPKTARLYEDIGVFTADDEVGYDLTQLFNILTGFSEHSDFSRLLVAPANMRAELLRLIREQIGANDPRIVIKVNNLVDIDMIDALYEAGQAGVDIDLIIRSQCSLRPGQPGLSDSIRVRSIVGEFLEHSRIYKFGTGDDAQYFTGSADLMGRNLDRRFEALIPIEAQANRRRIDDILKTLLTDDTLAWELSHDGTWRKPEKRDGVNAHEVFKDRARQVADSR